MGGAGVTIGGVGVALTDTGAVVGRGTTVAVVVGRDSSSSEDSESI